MKKKNLQKVRVEPTNRHNILLHREPRRIRLASSLFSTPLFHSAKRERRSEYNSIYASASHHASRADVFAAVLNYTCVVLRSGRVVCNIATASF